MADTSTTHLGLIKQDPDTAYDYEKQDSNLETLDSEIFARGKRFNGEPVGSDGEFHIRTVPFAQNVESTSNQRSDETYLMRTSGGDASISDGDAWLMVLKGTRRHEGYIPQSIDMNVIPMERTPAPAITATLDEQTFEAYVGQAGTYTITYTDSWSTSPTLYGLTVSNTPINGDSITMDWDGENPADVTVTAAERPIPESISATIDDSVFVAYVESSGTTTLTYSTQWSADPTLYGITVIGTPIAGDVITITYVKEVRGTITQSDPKTFVSTGWNLYDNLSGYARLKKYSDTFGFKISGAYESLEFSESLEGYRITITPVSGGFTIPADGYLFVGGGNTTTTQVWMTWSDWGTTANGGVFERYTTTTVDITSFMETNFPYGLMQVGTIQDEIDLNSGVATSNVLKQTYNATNLANAKASGRQYEYDENYIYIERATPVTYTITVDGGYTASDHGLEWFTGTDQPVYTETVYGNNLKNKLERDVLTISQQTLTAAEQSQVRTNIGAADNTKVMHTTGDESVSGIKQFMNGVRISNSSSRYRYITFKNKAGETDAGYIRFDMGNATNQTSNQIAFYEYSPKAAGSQDSGNSGYTEAYTLPKPNVGRNSETGSATYSILTSKAGISSYLVDNLTSTATDKALTAAQGKTLYDNKVQKLTFSIAKSSSKTFTVSASSRIVMFGFGPSTNLTGSVQLFRTSSTSLTVSSNTFGSNITITKSGTNITVANANTSYTAYFYCLVFAGGLTEVTT